MPLLIGFWVLFALIMFRDRLWKYATHFFPALTVGELEIDEDLANYFTTLDDHDRNWSIKEEENCRKVLKMKILNDETIERLNSTKLEKEHMQGVHSYDILANPLYLDDF